MNQGVGIQGVTESRSQVVKDSRSQGVKESRSQRVSKVILETSKVYPIITDSVRVDRMRVYDNGHRQTDKQTNRVTFVLLEASDFQSPPKKFCDAWFCLFED